MNIRHLLFALTLFPLVLACELGPVPEGTEYGVQEAGLSDKMQMEGAYTKSSREPMNSDADFMTSSAIAMYDMSYDTCGPGQKDGCDDTSVTVTMPYMFGGQIEWCECTGQEIQPIKDVSFSGVVAAGTCTPALRIPTAVQKEQCSTEPLTGMKEACKQADANATKNLPACSGECLCTWDNGNSYPSNCISEGRPKTHRTLNWANRTCTVDAEQECACNCYNGGTAGSL